MTATIPYSKLESAPVQTPLRLSILLAAFLFLLFANGVNTIGLAAWIGPLLLLRFVRSTRPWRGLGLAYTALTLAFAFQFRGMIPVSGASHNASAFLFGFLFICGAGLLLLLPYAADCWLAPRYSGVTRTLVFPLTMVVVEYLCSFGPYGSWGSSAYSQFENLPLLQILPLTGMWGVTFLLAWFAPVANSLWEQGWKPESVQNVRRFAIVISLVMIGGGIRLALFAPSSGTVRVAGLGSGKSRQWADLAQDNKYLEPLDMTEAESLLARSAKEADAGAQILLWPEADVTLYKATSSKIQPGKDDAAAVTLAREFCRAHQVYLLMAMQAVDLSKRSLDQGSASAVPALQPGLFDNRAILIEPDGNIAWEYRKAHFFLGEESRLSIRGDGHIHGTATPLGRIGTAMGTDLDFPTYMQRAGEQRLDILLVPANDWQALGLWHARVATFRGVENGFSVVRQAAGGTSTATDFMGRTLAVSDQSQSRNHALIAEVPTRGILTLYALIGDWFAWVCCIGTAVLLGRGISRSVRQPIARSGT